MRRFGRNLNEEEKTKRGRGILKEKKEAGRRGIHDS